MAKSEVDTWFDKLEHPLKEVMQDVRNAILKADRRMEECIKWQSPTFMYQGNLASINPRAKKHISLMFHTGAQIPGKFPNLQGGKATARFMAFEDRKAVKTLNKELVSVVKAWCAMKEVGAKPAATKKAAAKTAKKKAAKTAATKKTVKKALKKTTKKVSRKAVKKAAKKR